MKCPEIPKFSKTLPAKLIVFGIPLVISFFNPEMFETPFSIVLIIFLYILVIEFIWRAIGLPLTIGLFLLIQFVARWLIA